MPGDTPWVKLALRLLGPAAGLKWKCELELGASREEDVGGDRYCSGKVDVPVELCSEARSDHTPAGGCGGCRRAWGDIGWDTERLIAVLAGTLGGNVGARAGEGGAEVADGREGLTGGSVWDRNGFENDEEDAEDLTDAADREGPR